MSQDKITQLLSQLSDELTKRYGDVPHDSYRRFDFSVNEINVGTMSCPNQRFVYSVTLDIDTTKNENYHP